MLVVLSFVRLKGIVTSKKISQKEKEDQALLLLS